MTRPPDPTPDDLRRFLLGLLPSADHERVEAWVAAAPDAAAALRRAECDRDPLADAVAKDGWAHEDGRPLAPPEIDAATRPPDPTKDDLRRFLLLGDLPAADRERVEAWAAAAPDVEAAARRAGCEDDPFYKFMLHRVVKRMAEARAAAAPKKFLDPGYRLGPDGRFEVRRKLGEGGMGAVLAAYDHKLGREVAVKVIRPGLADTLPETVERFRREVRAQAAVAAVSENVLPVYDLHRDPGGSVFFDMFLVDGGSLEDRLRRRAYHQIEAARLVGEVARGVARGHEMGVVHRDLKPGNILIPDDRRPPLVADFGLVGIWYGGHDCHSGPGLTRTGTFLGTPAYMAPEQAANPQEADLASDVYSLGVVLYRLLAGRLPFVPAPGEDTASFLSRTRGLVPDPPSRHNWAVHPHLDAICLTCLRKDPAGRYTAAELAAELGRIADMKPPLTVGLRPLAALRRVPRCQWLAALGGCGGAAVGAALGSMEVGLAAVIGAAGGLLGRSSSSPARAWWGGLGDVVAAFAGGLAGALVAGTGQPFLTPLVKFGAWARLPQSTFLSGEFSILLFAAAVGASRRLVHGPLVAAAGFVVVAISISIYSDGSPEDLTSVCIRAAVVTVTVSPFTIFQYINDRLQGSILGLRPTAVLPRLPTWPGILFKVAMIELLTMLVGSLVGASHAVSLRWCQAVGLAGFALVWAFQIQWSAVIFFDLDESDGFLDILDDLVDDDRFPRISRALTLVKRSIRHWWLVGRCPAVAAFVWWYAM